MFQGIRSRTWHYVLLLGVASLLFFPNLGVPSLWDIDEGNNSEAAREMLECGNWVVPTFNFELRVDKPVLLYWLQMSAYHWLGVHELAARLPSALAALARASANRWLASSARRWASSSERRSAVPSCATAEEAARVQIKHVTAAIFFMTPCPPRSGAQ